MYYVYIYICIYIYTFSQWLKSQSCYFNVPPIPNQHIVSDFPYFEAIFVEVKSPVRISRHVGLWLDHPPTRKKQRLHSMAMVSAIDLCCCC